MSTADVSTKELNQKQRDWLKQIGNAFGVSSSSAEGGNRSPGGADPETEWKQALGAFKDAVSSLKTLEAARHPEAGDIRNHLGAIKKDADQSNFSEAIRSFTELQSKIKAACNEVQEGDGRTMPSPGNLDDMDEPDLRGVNPELTWKQRLPKFKGAVSVLKELEEAQFPAAAEYRKQLAAIKKDADDGNYPNAVKAFDGLLPKIQADYDKLVKGRSHGVRDLDDLASGGKQPAGGTDPAPSAAPAGPSATTTPAAPAGPAPPAADPNAAKYQKEVLKVGSKGPAVEYLQNTLNGSGAGLTVDGKFGPATQKAVKSFQAGKGLTADGVVGPKTWGALGGTSGGGTPAAGPGQSAQTPAQPAQKTGQSGQPAAPGQPAQQAGQPSGTSAGALSYEPGEREASQKSPGGAEKTSSGYVLFNFGVSQSSLKSEHQQFLAGVVKELNLGDPNAETSVKTTLGFADAIGDESLNAQLRNARANAVRQFLLDQGTSQETIGTSGAASAGTFLAPNTSRDGRSRNRAVTIDLMKVIIEHPVDPNKCPPPIPPICPTEDKSALEKAAKLINEALGLARDLKERVSQLGSLVKKMVIDSPCKLAALSAGGSVIKVGLEIDAVIGELALEPETLGGATLALIPTLIALASAVQGLISDINALEKCLDENGDEDDKNALVGIVSGIQADINRLQAIASELKDLASK